MTERGGALALASGAQLAAGLAGLGIAVRRRHAYEFLWLRGRADALAADALLVGTALSAPGPMLAAQAALTVAQARRPGRAPAAGLGLLGAAMVAGYLGERLVRRRLRPAGWDGLESPVVLAGLGLAAAMALLGAAAWRDGGAR